MVVGAKSGKTALAFLTPHMAGFMVFTLIPVVETFVISLFKWNLINSPRFTGFSNYIQMVTNDGFFWRAMINTLYYTAGSVLLVVTTSLTAALLLNQGIRFRSLLRTLYFVPNVSSLVAVSLVWMWIYNSDFGLINRALALIGVENGPRWLANPELAMPSVIVMGSWTQVGFFTVIFLAGLQGIPTHLYEAAELDGCRWPTKLFRITLPMLSPTTFFVLIISIINSFQVFEQTFVMTKGGPAFSTTTAVMYIYQQAFKYQEMGYASAISWGLFLCILVVTIFQVRLQRRWVFYGS